MNGWLLQYGTKRGRNWDEIGTGGTGGTNKWDGMGTGRDR